MAGVGTPAHAQLAPLPNLTSILSSIPDGSWAKVSLNQFSSTYPAPAESVGNPVGVITAWSSFAWDSNRGNLMLFGGGHANYAGNEMYLWSGTTQQWTRGSLPSQVTPVQVPAGFAFIPVDGALNAPSSAHTYDGNVYLPAADRFLTLPGPIYNAGGPVVEIGGGATRPTGPYTFDPARADPNQVGGTTGSGVDPSRLGSRAWHNRDNFAALATVTTWAGTTGVSPVDGTSAVTVENGKDVIYWTGRAGPVTYLGKQTIHDLANPSSDTYQVLAGGQSGVGAYGSGAIDPAHGLYVALTDTAAFPFTVFDLSRPAAYNTNSVAISFTTTGPAFDGRVIGGLEYDPTRDAFMIWTGAGDVWRLKRPVSGIITDPWALALVTDGDTFAAGAIPDGMSPAGGVRGKWKYIPNLDAFMALEGNATGEVWLYRPDGWTVVEVPEPRTLALLALGLGVVILRMRRVGALEH